MMYRHDPRRLRILLIASCVACFLPVIKPLYAYATPLSSATEGSGRKRDEQSPLTVVQVMAQEADRPKSAEGDKSEEQDNDDPEERDGLEEQSGLEDGDEREEQEDAIADGDPDLGILRAYPNTEPDPDLGILRALPQQPEPPQRPVVYFTAGSSVFYSDNVFSSTDPQEDGIFRAGLGLRAVPALGSRTFAVFAANGNITRYVEESSVNYDELELSASLFRQITRRAYIDVGWRNEQLFRESGDRFLSDHQLQLSIGRRDQLGPLQVDSSYQLRRSFADPEDRSRLLNRLRLSARYPLNQDLDLGLSYQLGLTSFTQSSRDDHYQQILGQLSYQPNRQTSISLFGGGRFGGSDEDDLDFDSALFGVSVGVNLPLF
ncbi:MAG: hypothetical protein AAF289_04035 [Cyanobacteria bacterium P01_A01_bin.135]